MYLPYIGNDNGYISGDLQAGSLVLGTRTGVFSCCCHCARLGYAYYAYVGLQYPG